MTTAAFTIAPPLFLVDLGPVLSPSDALARVEMIAPSGSSKNPLLFMYAGPTISPTTQLLQAVSGACFSPSFTNGAGVLSAICRNGTTVTIALTAVARTQNLSFGAPNTAPAKTPPYPTIFGNQR